MGMFFALLGTFSMFVVPVCLLLLIVKAIRKKPFKKTALTMLSFFIVFIACGIGTISLPEPTQEDFAESEPQTVIKVPNSQVEKELEEQKINYVGYSKLDKYEWGAAASEVLKSIGVECIKKVKVVIIEGTDVISDILVTTDKKELDLYATKSEDVWDILHIYDKNTLPRANYYYADTLKYNDDGILIVDIYDYSTGEIIEVANIEAKKTSDKESQQNLEEFQARMQENEEKEKQKQTQESMETFTEIYNAYKANQISADDIYKGNRYTLTAIVDKMKEDGLSNTVFDTIGVTAMIKVNNTNVYIFCSFDENDRDKLKKYNKGDTITFTAECLSSGNWTDCQIID